MAKAPPPPLSSVERRKRLRRIRRIARKLGFHGTIEYRHTWSETGGAQFALGPTPADDILVVFAEAFERDSDPDDFSLEAIIAHERGHQLLRRESKLSRMVTTKIGTVSEEILASLIGSLIAEKEEDREVLYYKALFDMVTRGMDLAQAVRLVDDLRSLLEKIL
jgi:hypothetical protein